MALAVSTLVFGVHPPSAKGANLNPAEVQLCYQATLRASQKYNIPHDVMLAISLTETGKKIGGKINPWPWTINMEGIGKWFSNKADSMAYVKSHFARGARSFDVGCFQINYKWHHKNFSSLEAMFDPQINADYAAKYLGDLFRETGSWTKAAGFYHSRTPKYATKYSARFERYRARLTGRSNAPAFEGHGSESLKVAQAPITPAAPATQMGRLPIINLTNANLASASRLGSLVPQTDTGRSLLRRTTRPLF